MSCLFFCTEHLYPPIENVYLGDMQTKSMNLAVLLLPKQLAATIQKVRSQLWKGSGDTSALAFPPMIPLAQLPPNGVLPRDIPWNNCSIEVDHTPFSDEEATMLPLQETAQLQELCNAMATNGGTPVSPTGIYLGGPGLFALATQVLQEEIPLSLFNDARIARLLIEIEKGHGATWSIAEERRLS